MPVEPGDLPRRERQPQIRAQGAAGGEIPVQEPRGRRGIGEREFILLPVAIADMVAPCRHQRRQRAAMDMIAQGEEGAMGQEGRQGRQERGFGAGAGGVVRGIHQPQERPMERAGQRRDPRRGPRRDGGVVLSPGLSPVLSPGETEGMSAADSAPDSAADSPADSSPVGRQQPQLRPPGQGAACHRIERKGKAMAPAADPGGAQIVTRTGGGRARHQPAGAVKPDLGREGGRVAQGDPALQRTPDLAIQGALPAAPPCKQMPQRPQQMPHAIAS